jgi:hypothetical protein
MTGNAFGGNGGAGGKRFGINATCGNGRTPFSITRGGAAGAGGAGD